MTSKELKEIRTSLGFTQEELGKRLGVRKNTVWRWEKEERRIPETVARLMQYLAKDEREEQKRKKTWKP
jgi:transcriptional regulator with XRE-family HTH domain